MYFEANLRVGWRGDDSGKLGSESRVLFAFQLNNLLICPGLYPLGLKPRDTTPMDMEVKLPGLGQS